LAWAAVTYLDITMVCRMTDEPEESNIIDFVEIKMLRMFEDYSASGEFDSAAAIWDALSAYLDGTIDIIFRRGQPYMQAIDIIDDA